MRVAICEDEKIQLEAFLKLYEQVSSDFKEAMSIDTFESAEELLARFHYQQHPFDIIFLDIGLGQLNGIDAAKEIRKLDQQVQLVFLTGTIDYSLEGYEVGALRYLLKPINAEKLKAILLETQDRQEVQAIMISNKFGQKKVLLNQLRYVESYQRKLFFHSTNGEESIYGKLSEIELKLSEHDFCRCHQSYLVNLAFVEELLPGSLLLDDGTSLPISKANKKQFKEAFFQYLSQGGITLD